MAAGVAADPALIGVAETHMAALWDSLRDGKLPEAAAANLAVAEMGAALAGNPTWVPAGDPRAADANRLDQAHTDLLRALNACLEGAKMRYTVATDRWRWLDIDYPRPTRFGNVKAVVEAYPKRVYEVDFYYLWPRLQLVMAKDQEAPSALILARAQVDFALLFLALMTLSWAFWMVLLPAWRTGSLVFLAVSIIGPFLIAAGYQLAIAAEREFGDVMKASIDRNRLEVLKMLKQKKPVGLFAERDLWRRLQKAERAAQAEEIIYSSE
jgi:hypothetical protein